MNLQNHHGYGSNEGGDNNERPVRAQKLAKVKSMLTLKASNLVPDEIDEDDFNDSKISEIVHLNAANGHCDVPRSYLQRLMCSNLSNHQ